MYTNYYFHFMALFVGKPGSADSIVSFSPVPEMKPLEISGIAFIMGQHPTISVQALKHQP